MCVCLRHTVCASCADSVHVCLPHAVQEARGEKRKRAPGDDGAEEAEDSEDGDEED